MPLDDMPRRHYAPRHYAPRHYAPGDTMPRDTMPRWHYAPVDDMPRWTLCPGRHYARRHYAPGDTMPQDTMPRFTLLDPVGPYLTLLDPVWPCLTQFNPVRSSLTPLDLVLARFWGPKTRFPSPEGNYRVTRIKNLCRESWPRWHCIKGASAPGAARLIFSNQYLYGEFHCVCVWCEGVCTGISVTFTYLACVECPAVFRSDKHSVTDWGVGELSKHSVEFQQTAIGHECWTFLSNIKQKWLLPMKVSFSVWRIYPPASIGPSYCKITLLLPVKNPTFWHFFWMSSDTILLYLGSPLDQVSTG